MPTGSTDLTKPLVLVVSINGRTGRSIADSLLASGDFRIASIVRSSSVHKPTIETYRARGVEIRVGEIADPDSVKLDELVKGVDILILAVLAMVDQRPILLAAKRAGVKRVVPSDFAPPIPRGVLGMNDLKLDVREFIRAEGIPYTFIDVGYWAHGLMPYSHNVKVNIIEGAQNTFRGDGKARILCTSLAAVGEFVKRIIVDSRTLNQAVITWEYDVTLKEVWDISKTISGETFEDYPKMSFEEIQKLCQSSDPLLQIMGQYADSVFVREDCTLSKAKLLGDLDARELYPDYSPAPYEEIVEAFYKNPPTSEKVDLSSLGDSEAAKEYTKSQQETKA